MRILRTLFTIGLALLTLGSAQADIIFSEVEVTTDFGQYSVFSMGNDAYLDSLFFHFVDAAVGDDHAPIYTGEITLSYTVTADNDLLLSSLDQRGVGRTGGYGVDTKRGFHHGPRPTGSDRHTDTADGRRAGFPVSDDARVRPPVRNDPDFADVHAKCLGWGQLQRPCQPGLDPTSVHSGAACRSRPPWHFWVWLFRYLFGDAVDECSIRPTWRSRMG